MHPYSSAETESLFLELDSFFEVSFDAFSDGRTGAQSCEGIIPTAPNWIIEFHLFDYADI